MMGEEHALRHWLERSIFLIPKVRRYTSCTAMEANEDRNSRWEWYSKKDTLNPALLLSKKAPDFMKSTGWAVLNFLEASLRKLGPKVARHE